MWATPMPSSWPRRCEQARDAAAAIQADITELPAIVDMAQAVADKSNRVHDEIADNVCFDWGWIEDNRAKVDEAFKTAPHVTTLELVNNRLVPNAMEPRASHRRLRRGHGRLQALHHQPEPAPAPPADLGLRDGHPREQADRDRARRGRRLRQQDLSLRRGGGRSGGGEGDQPPSEMGGGPQRKLPVGCPWPRPCDEDRARHATRRATSLPCGPRRWRMWAPICRTSRPRRRPSCTAR